MKSIQRHQQQHQQQQQHEHEDANEALCTDSTRSKNNNNMENATSSCMKTLNTSDTTTSSTATNNVKECSTITHDSDESCPVTLQHVLTPRAALFLCIVIIVYICSLVYDGLHRILLESSLAGDHNDIMDSTISIFSSFSLQSWFCGLLCGIVGVVVALMFFFYKAVSTPKPLPPVPLLSRAQSRPEIPRTLNQLLNTESSNVESCLWLNLLLSHMWCEFRDSSIVRSKFLADMQIEFDELIETPAGAIIEYICVRDYFLGLSLPVVHSVSVVEFSEEHAELSLALDLSYDGGLGCTVYAELVFGLSGTLSCYLKRLEGQLCLSFYHEPIPHWTASFYDDPIMEFEVESTFEGKKLPQLTSLIIAHIRRSIRKKHTLPHFVVRPFRKPTSGGEATKIVSNDSVNQENANLSDYEFNLDGDDGGNDFVYVLNTPLLLGVLTVTICEISELPERYDNIFCRVSLDAVDAALADLDPSKDAAYRRLREVCTFSTSAVRANKGLCSWGDSFTFNITPENRNLEIVLVQRHVFGRDQLISKVKVPLEELPLNELSSDAIISRLFSLHAISGSSKTASSIRDRSSSGLFSSENRTDAELKSFGGNNLGRISSKDNRRCSAPSLITDPVTGKLVSDDVIGKIIIEFRFSSAATKKHTNIDCNEFSSKESSNNSDNFPSRSSVPQHESFDARSRHLSNYIESLNMN